MKPTFASVTEVPCTCGSLQRDADNPHTPIAFDPCTNEYHFQWNGSSKIIYHCPFCGGAAPKSQRAHLFASIPDVEEIRLAAILAPIRSIQDAIEILGTPDSQVKTRLLYPESETGPPEIAHRNCFVYSQLSGVADVVFREHEDGRLSWRLKGKFIGHPSK